MLATGEPRNTAVSLAQMLDRREQRVASQQALLARFGQPLVQLTLVTPGPVKDTAQARLVFAQGLAAVELALSQAGQQVLAQEGVYLPTGPESLMVIASEPLYLKSLMLQLEEHHALGRLWDVDVINATGASVTRQQLGGSPRRCLVCEQPAHACARSSQHALAEVQHAIQEKIDAFLSRCHA